MKQFKILHRDNKARVGELTTLHGVIETPEFIPVGADLIVAFDDHESIRMSKMEIQRSLDLTEKWGLESLKALKSHNSGQLMYGVVHGALHKDLRIGSARFTDEWICLTVLLQPEEPETAPFIFLLFLAKELLYHNLATIHREAIKTDSFKKLKAKFLGSN